MSDGRLYPPLAALRAFEAAGRLGGIRKAAKELSIDHTVVSRHLRTLETWLGTPLMQRNRSDTSLTNEGKRYHDQICEGLSIIANATGEFLNGSGPQHLHIWCIPGFATLWLADHLSDFMTRNPDIVVDFRPTDYSPDFRFKDVDGDIRYLRRWEEDKLPRTVRTLEFARPSVFPVASMDCLAQLPEINGPEDLLTMPLLHEDNDLEWRHWFMLQGIDVREELPGPRLWHAHLTLNAARQGHGIALANELLMGGRPDDNRLVPLVPRGKSFEPVRFGGYTFISREDQWNVPATKRFRHWLQATSSHLQ